MSVQIDGNTLKAFKNEDPELSVSSQRGYLVSTGAASKTTMIYTTSNKSTSLINWGTMTVDSTETVMSRHMKIEVPVRVTCSGLGATVNIRDGSIALREKPIASATQSINFGPNGQQISIEPFSTIHATSRFFDNDSLSRLEGGGLNAPDQSPQYNDLVGSSMNPLAGYLSSNPSGYESRGTFNENWTVITNSTSSFVFETTIFEDVYISPLNWAPDSYENGLVNLSQFTLSYQFADLTRILASRLAFSSVAVAILDNPNLHVTYLTKQPNQDVPKQVIYSYDNFVPYATDMGSVTAGQTKTQQISNINPGQIPKLLYIYVCETPTSKTYKSTDTYAYISNIIVKYNNQSGILGDFSAYDLYCLSVKNGLRGVSWTQWKKFRGSIICIDVARDLRLGVQQAPSLMGYQGNLSLTVQYTSLFDHSADMSLYVLPIVEGVLTIGRDGFSTQWTQGVLTPEQVMDSVNLPSLPSDKYSPRYGGSLWDKFKSAVGWIKDHKLISSVAGSIPHPIAQQVAGVAGALGFGYGGAKTSTDALRAKVFRE